MFDYDREVVLSETFMLEVVQRAELSLDNFNLSLFRDDQAGTVTSNGHSEASTARNRKSSYGRLVRVIMAIDPYWFSVINTHFHRHI